MKTLFTFLLFLILSFSSTCIYSQPFNLQNQVSPVIPDVMNMIAKVDNLKDGRIIYETFSTDSFPVFTGFPKAISGSTIEGGYTAIWIQTLI